MNKVRSTLIALTTGVLATGSMVLAAGPAAADGPPTPSARAFCDPGDFCAWQDTDYRPTSGVNGRAHWFGNDTSWGSNINNKATSFWNRGIAGNLDDVRVYNGSNWSGSSFCLTRGSWWSDISQAPPEGAGRPALDNFGSSHRWVGSC